MFLVKLNQIFNKFLPKAASLCFVVFIISCGRDPYLYDRTGFDENARPVVAPNPNAVNASAPDYYRQPYPPQYYQQSSPYNSYPPVYQQYPQGAPYQTLQYQGGGSRYYSNPYAIPPAAPNYQRYDVDQYYVPPTYYNNIEQQRPVFDTQGNRGNLNY